MIDRRAFIRGLAGVVMVDVIVASYQAAALAAQRATKTIPIVMVRWW